MTKIFRVGGGIESIAQVRAGFIGRTSGVDVCIERGEVLERLRPHHRLAAEQLGFSDMPLVRAEQVHGVEIGIVRGEEILSVGAGRVLTGVDAIATDMLGICLGIYVADCAAVYLVERTGRAIALVHSGKHGTELGIAVRAVEVLRREFFCAPENLVAVISPCIRPPYYEVDFAKNIRSQLAVAGVGPIHDDGICTAANLQDYYSYRMEKGKTGRMLALLAKSRNCSSM